MKKIISFLFLALILFLMASLCFYPARYISQCLDGLKLWVYCVLPSLLPFFFLTALLTATGSLEKLSKLFSPVTKRLYNCGGVSAYVQIISLISGYPVGAKLICDLHSKQLISDDESTRMSTFCSTSGPMFIVGSVGISLFHNKQFALVFLVVHILGSIACGLIFRNYGVNRAIDGHLPKKELDNVLYDSIYQSVITIIIVGGFIAIFYTLAQIVYDFQLLFIIEKPLSYLVGSTNAKGVLQGLIECTMGCVTLSSNNTHLSASLACSLIAFGGLSVICQSVAFLKKAKVKISIFILSKAIQMTISFVLCFIILKIFC